MYYPVALIDKLIEWHNMEKLLTSLFLFSDIYDIIFFIFWLNYVNMTLFSQELLYLIVYMSIALSFIEISIAKQF